MSENANKRTDDYGGSIDNRVRFTAEVATGIAEEIGADRAAVHISPGNTLNDMFEGDTEALLSHADRGTRPARAGISQPRACG
jgi:N-ethylmaleimide reductase